MDHKNIYEKVPHYLINTWKPTLNDHNYIDDSLKYISFKDIYFYMIHISLKYVPVCLNQR